MKTKLLKIIRKNFIIMKPNEFTLFWTAWDKTSISPYAISKSKNFRIVIQDIIFYYFGKRRGKKIMEHNERNFLEKTKLRCF